MSDVTVNYAFQSLFKMPFFEPPVTCFPDDQCRSTWEIVRSCLVTIFACTWLALHPNIPDPRKSHGFLDQTLSQAKMMLIALIAPEITVLWASRQWYASKEVAKQYAAYEWTQTHAFFALMGGFAVVIKYPSGSKQLERLSPYHLEQYLQTAQISLTETEIQDRSKGDFLAKGLILLQTIWFIVQFFARIAAHLPVTELELATIAFATLNFATYFFWWNKPLNVRCVLEIHVKEGDFDSYTWSTSFSYQTSPSPPRTLPALLPYPSIAIPPLIHPPNRRVAFKPPTTPSPPQPSDVQDTGNGDRMARSIANVCCVICHVFTWPFHLIVSIFQSIHGAHRVILGQFQKAILGSGLQFGEQRRFIHESYMPYYYGKLSSEDGTKVMFIFMCLAITFGAMHCSAWGFSYSSNIDKYIWRTSSLIITASPIYGLIYYFIFKAHVSRLDNIAYELFYILTGRRFRRFIDNPIRIAYVLARVILLVQMFVLLRSAPENVFKTVQWTNFIPHV